MFVMSASISRLRFCDAGLILSLDGCDLVTQQGQLELLIIVFYVRETKSLSAFVSQQIAGVIACAFPSCAPLPTES
jgi:hypothetical protein